MPNFLSAIPFRVYVATAAVVAIGAGFTAFVIHERQLGALNEKVRTVEAERKAAVAHADSMRVIAQVATQSASDSVAKAMALVAKGRVLEARTREAATVAGTERERATALLRDSLATLANLRGEVERLVVTGRADSTASAVQHQADTISIRALLVSIKAKDAAIDAGVAAQNAVIQRAILAEREVTLLKKGDGFGSLIKGALLFTVGAGAGYILHK